MSAAELVPTIGLEVHMHLKTRTKMFCGCRVDYDARPNSLVCPVCLGMPGVLPVMNGKAVELAVRMALALGCAIPDYAKWDRKHYYYPDLPKNYQISE
jgi:aspartyl-tRNA(Asn)/glutamyl-tRNA(Gln) amidotransferase subunit B